jgi:hypothetical protein
MPVRRSGRHCVLDEDCAGTQQCRAMFGVPRQHQACVPVLSVPGCSRAVGALGMNPPVQLCRPLQVRVGLPAFGSAGRAFSPWIPPTNPISNVKNHPLVLVQLASAGRDRDMGAWNQHATAHKGKPATRGTRLMRWHVAAVSRSLALSLSSIPSFADL